MSHWAELNSDNVVLRVVVGDNNDPAGDEGYQWLLDNLGGKWVKTSYNTINGIHYGPDGLPDNGVPFRRNYAGVGYIYDEQRDAFIPQKPKPYTKEDGTQIKDFIFNESTYCWDEVIDF